MEDSTRQPIRLISLERAEEIAVKAVRDVEADLRFPLEYALAQNQRLAAENQRLAALLEEQ
jgi:hypothetical protein